MLRPFDPKTNKPKVAKDYTDEEKKQVEALAKRKTKK